MKIGYILIIIATSIIYVQDCPPSDTLTIDISESLWNIPNENSWNKIEVMTWNIKDFPISNNTIGYVSEIILDLLPDIIAFQEINNASAFTNLANSIPAYEFINSGSGLALAVRSDVIEILSWSTLFPSAGYEFAWRYPILAELNWICGNSAILVNIINIHLKSGNSTEDFNRRYSSSQYLSDFIYEHSNDNIIILGDYNDEITDFENNNSLWPLLINNNIAFTTQDIANIDYYSTFPSWPSFIDHIAISSNLFDEFLTSNIKTIRVDDYTGYNFYHSYISDHRPLIWSFEVESIDLYSGLIINEIMQNPASISDAVGEWIEITNISLDTINLNGLIISDNDGEQHIISDENLTINPGNFIILGANNNQEENGNVIMDYEYNNFTLSNLWDEVIISHPNGTIIDEVYYDNGNTFPDETGKSMMLINPILDNNLGENWSISNTTFSSGDFGTPGQENFPNACNYVIGDINMDEIWNILDIVILANCIITQSCNSLQNSCSCDINLDQNFNVLDIVLLANCVLNQNCESIN